VENVFALIKYALFGFFGLLALLLVVALLFGKRVKKRWEYEAEFRDIGGNEFGEFDFEMSKIEKEEPEYTFKATFRMRHESLEKGLVIQVYLDDLLVMRGHVEKSGRIYLRKSAVLNAVADPAEGQVCRVVWGGIEQFRATIKPD
jgi:hypothetical protein